jgi:hypothetical protein
MKREKSRMYGIDRWLCAVAVCAAGLSSAQAAVVSGRLTEPPAHRAVKGATIEIVELHRSVVTGTDGGFKFANVAAGEYTLRITVSGKKDRSVDKRFAVDDDHDFVANVTLTSAARGLWNIPHPADGKLIVPNVVIAPVVGFDLEGFRLGYGGGFFDRTLARLNPKPLTIGVGYPEAELRTIFPQPHDIPMDWVVTGSGTLYAHIDRHA